MKREGTRLSLSHQGERDKTDPDSHPILVPKSLIYNYFYLEKLLFFDRKNNTPRKNKVSYNTHNTHIYIHINTLTCNKISQPFFYKSYEKKTKENKLYIYLSCFHTIFHLWKLHDYMYISIMMKNDLAII